MPKNSNPEQSDVLARLEEEGVSNPFAAKIATKFREETPAQRAAANQRAADREQRDREFAAEQRARERQRSSRGPRRKATKPVTEGWGKVYQSLADALQATAIRHSDVSVYVVITLAIDRRRGDARLKRETIGEKTGLKKRAVAESLRRLTAAGLIGSQKQWRKDGSQGASIYWLTSPALAGIEGTYVHPMSSDRGHVRAPLSNPEPALIQKKLRTG